MATAAKWMSDVSGVKPALGAVPDGIEVDPRYGENKVVYVIVNFAKGEETVTLPVAMVDVLSGRTKQSVTLPPFGVAVLSSRQ
jgi:beta-galactosidase